ncbi:MAG: hypothetical protein H8E66_23380 [Planctomycetes bacterium]|nr:hypothetical protein [Planctomycetota bacterium]
MNESRIEATDRLRREGRWSEASKFKDATVKRLRAEGKPKAEASELAWREMMTKYSPLPSSEPQPKSDDPLSLEGADPEVIDRLAEVAPDWDRDVRWTYTNFAHPNPRIETAPSLSAWGLLGFARGEPNKFFSQILPPVMAAADEAKSDEPAYVDSDPGLADLKKMAAQVQAAEAAKRAREAEATTAKHAWG